MDLNEQYIELTDGENTFELLLLDTFGIEEQDYAALLDEGSEELYIFEIELDNDEAVLVPIEDENELEEVLAIYAELLDEYDEED